MIYVSNYLILDSTKCKEIVILVSKPLQKMRTYQSKNQLRFEEFKSPFERNLNPENKWVKLAEELPWDDCAKIYLKKMSVSMGRPSLDARLAIGVLIIKHMKGLSDRDVVEELSENLYLQYFVGFSSFQPQMAFDPSLFVSLRKRMGIEAFDEMNDLIIIKALGIKKEEERKQKDSDSTPPSVKTPKEELDEKGSKGKEPKHRGKLKIDATVVDQMIVYPTDLSLLNRSREELERLIDVLHLQNKKYEKPRTYRRVARKAYLALAMKKQKANKALRKAIGQQLNYVNRNIKTIHKMWDEAGDQSSPFNFRDLKIFWVIQHLYTQQRKMHTDRSKSHPNRIVNIYQPYIRPIPRGKAKSKVEFGAKLGVSEFEGFSRLDHLSWEAYHEGKGDLVNQVEGYKRLKGCYPEVVLCDGIYLTRENRKWLKDKKIRHVGRPLGKPKTLTAYFKRKLKKERGMRNHIEAKFGQGKNKYEMDRIRARRQDTSESWIAALVFVLNLVRWNKILPILLFIVYQLVLFLSILKKVWRQPMWAIDEFSQSYWKKPNMKTYC